MSTETVTLSDVCQKQITRKNGVAEVIWDYYEGHPIRLFGFSVDATLSDFQIHEQAFAYYQRLEKFATE